MPIAVETFKQALLTSLTNDYATSAVVQVPADVVVAGALESEVAGHEGESIPARFYGAVSTNKPDPQTTPYTISSAFLPLPNGASTQYPTFVVSAKHPKAQADLNLRLFYDIAFLEHDFLTLEGHYGYIPSSWVTFALPPAKTAPDDDHPTLGPPMGEVDPIALRSYPQIPTLFKHAATADTGDDPLAHLEWDYQATVSTLRGVAQEELWLELTFNDLVDAPDRDDAEAGEQPSTDLATRGDRERPPPADLFAALGRFVWEYPQIEASLEPSRRRRTRSPPTPAPTWLSGGWRR